MIYPHQKTLGGKQQTHIISFRQGADGDQIDGSGENNWMQFMTDVKHQNDKLVFENVIRTGRKVQLILIPNRPFQADQSWRKFFLLSAMEPVYGKILKNDDFLTVVDKVSILCLHSQHREMVRSQTKL